jgi:hypothetical protein
MALMLAFAAASGAAAPIERKLPDHLVYIRVHALPADLPTDDSVRQHPCVVDLRYTQADTASAGILVNWVKFHCSPRTPMFVLVNGSTAPALVTGLRREVMPGLLTAGVAAQRFEPDLIVTQSAADERRAYDALEQGTDIAALITDHPDKLRNDEASLAQERTTEPPADDTEESPAPGAAEKQKPAPTDAALQRAVHVYEGLRALKVL